MPTDQRQRPRIRRPTTPSLPSASTTATFTNAGTLAKNAGTNTSQVQISVTDASTGTITATSGTMEFDAASNTIDGTIGGTSSGVVFFANGASITTTGTATILDDGGSAGLVVGNSATWTDSGVIYANGLLQVGNANGASVVTIAATARCTLRPTSPICCRRRRWPTPATPRKAR